MNFLVILYIFYKGTIYTYSRVRLSPSELYRRSWKQSSTSNRYIISAQSHPTQATKKVIVYNLRSLSLFCQWLRSTQCREFETMQARAYSVRGQQLTEPDQTMVVILDDNSITYCARMKENRSFIRFATILELIKYLTQVE